MTYGFHSTVVLPVRRNLQDTTYDCGPASLKIILESLGKSFSEKKLLQIAGTTPRHGTPPKGLAKALTHFGIRHEIIPTGSIALLEEKIRSLNLCIVNYQAWGNSGREFKNLDTGHYSVVFGYTPTHVYIADPSKHKTPRRKGTPGVRTIRKDLFLKRWEDKTSSGHPHIKTHHWMMAVPLV